MYDNSRLTDSQIIETVADARAPLVRTDGDQRRRLRLRLLVVDEHIGCHGVLSNKERPENENKFKKNNRKLFFFFFVLMGVFLTVAPC